MAKLKEGEVLINSSDHCFYIGHIREQKAVYNHHDKSWYEYAGDDYLGEGDEVFVVKVAG